MPDATYDAVIVGAGHNGLCLAAYLARAGLSVAVFERRHEEGSGVNSEEATVPGFIHNLHAQYMEFIEYMPFYHDFELEKFGAKMIYPEAQAGIAFADGRPPIIIYNPKFRERTHESIARYSKADAERFNHIRHTILSYEGLIAAGIYSPPSPPPEGVLIPFDGPLAQIWKELGFERHDMLKSTKVIIDETFETPELRAILYRQCVEWGHNLHESVGGLGFLNSTMFLCGIHRLSVGGTHTLAHAMAQACLHQGVVLRYQGVDRVLVRNGRAVGVRLRDGTEVEARKLVASNVNIRHTFQDLVGEEHLSDIYRKRVRNFRFGPTHVLATTSFALHEAPDYKSARWDPDINKCFYTIVGFETDQQVSDYIYQAYGGRLPERPGAGTWVNSLWDSTQAPTGKHAMNGWFFFPKASCLTPDQWDEVRATWNDRFLELWAEYAPNMTRENVIADRLYTPWDIEHKTGMLEGDFSNGEFAHDQLAWCRPFPEAAGYRTEIENLYLCGPGSHPGGGVGAYCGYNAFKVICEDYDLPRVWQKPGRLY
jgi:phytoene dehydrogenase-like protein